MPLPNRQTLSPKPHLILASSSPRRRQLLAEAGYHFTVLPPDQDVECGVCSDFGPAGLVTDLAYRKATAVLHKLNSESPPLPFSSSPTLLLAADTVAECNGFILGKPRDEDDARAMLVQLSNRDHRVLTGVCLIPLPFSEGQGEGSLGAPAQRQSQPLIRVAVTKLRMDNLAKSEINDYLATGQWEGKAGAFGYQDRLGWVHIVEGSETNVVGLPMELLAEMLEEIQAGSNGPGAGSSE